MANTLDLLPGTDYNMGMTTTTPTEYEMFYANMRNPSFSIEQLDKDFQLLQTYSRLEANRLFDKIAKEWPGVRLYRILYDI